MPVLCATKKEAVYRGRQGQMHTLNNTVRTENVLIKVSQRQARM